MGYVNSLKYHSKQLKLLKWNLIIWVRTLRLYTAANSQKPHPYNRVNSNEGDLRT